MLDKKLKQLNEKYKLEELILLIDTYRDGLKNVSKQDDKSLLALLKKEYKSITQDDIELILETVKGKKDKNASLTPSELEEIMAKINVKTIELGLAISEKAKGTYDTEDKQLKYVKIKAYMKVRNMNNKGKKVSEETPEEE